MSRPVLVIRPEPGSTTTVEAGRGFGLAIEAYPLFEIQPVDWDAPDPDEIDALLLGSANAVRHGGPALAGFAGKPAYVVGSATGEAARAAGFPVVVQGRGHLQPVLDGLAGQKLRLLRVAGVERIPLTPPAGVTIETRAAYESVAFQMPVELSGQLRSGALVLLHSAAAARHFAAECDRCGLARDHIALAALGPRIADAAGDGWRSLRSASEPSDAALLALALEMCHDLS